MNKFFIQIIKNYRYQLLFIFIIGVILRFYGFHTQGYWMDEDFTFYLTKPNQSFFQILETLRYEHVVVGNPNAPALYYYLLNKFFYFFGYNPENGRIFSVIFSSLSIPVCFLISKLWTNNNLLSNFVSLLFCLNIYIIWEAQETRPQSIVLFFSMISVYFFSYSYLKKKNTIFFLLLVLFANLFLLSLHPVTFAVVFSQFIFLGYKYFFLKNFQNKRFFFTIIISIILYFFLNFNYLFNQISIPYEHFSKLSNTFFYSYHFKTFFGSVEFGVFNLILILFLFILNFKNLIKNEGIFFISLIIFFSYSSTVIISILKTGLMHPRYKIYCVPLILIWISISISYFKNYKKYLIILSILTMVNTILYIDNRHLPKPPTQEILKKISEEEEKNIFTHNVPWKPRYDNVLENYKIFRTKNLILIKNKKKLDEINGFWLICANKMRSIMIFRNDDPDIDCDLKLNNFLKISNYKYQDYIITRFRKK